MSGKLWAPKLNKEVCWSFVVHPLKKKFPENLSCPPLKVVQNIQGDPKLLRHPHGPQGSCIFAGFWITLYLSMIPFRSIEIYRIKPLKITRLCPPFFSLHQKIPWKLWNPTQTPNSNSNSKSKNISMAQVKRCLSKIVTF